MVITAGLVIPMTVMGLEICMLETAAPKALAKLPWNTGSAPVVTAKLALAPPMLNNAVAVLS